MVLSRRPARQVLAKRSGTKAPNAVSQVVRRPAANSVVASPAAKNVLAKPAGVNAPEAGRSTLESGVKQMRKPATAESNVLRKPVASATKVIQLSGKRMGRPPKVGTQPEATKRGAVPHTESTATGARRGRKPKVAQEESGPATTVDGTHVLSGKRKGRPPKVGTQPEAKKPAVQAVLAKPAGSNAAEDVSQVVSRPAASAVVASPAATILLAKPAGVNAPEAGVPSVESGVNEMRKPANAESNVLRKPVASATKVIQFSVKRRGRPPKVGTQPEAKERGAVPRTESTATGARRGNKPKLAHEESGPATTVDEEKGFKRKCKAFAAMIEMKKPGAFSPEQILSALKDAGGSAVKARHALLD